MEEKDLKQYNDIKQLLDHLKSRISDLNDVKVIFNSSDVEDKQTFASYQFPIEAYNEDLYNVLKEYAKIDYEITMRNYMDVGKTTKFKFVEPNSNEKLADYNYEHSLDFLEKMIDIEQLKK